MKRFRIILKRNPEYFSVSVVAINKDAAWQNFIEQFYSKDAMPDRAHYKIVEACRRVKGELK